METAGEKANRLEKATATTGLLHAYLDNGDITARNRLIELYIPLVESFAHRYERTEDYDDLFQAGCIGLINAIDRFDLERGGELTAFAVPNIVGEIKRHLRDRTTSVRMPRPIQELRARAVRCEAELGAILQRRPTAAEVARELGVDKEDVAQALSARRPDGEHEDASLGEGSREMHDLSDDRMMLASAFEVLNERERQIVYLRFVRDRSRAEVAEELGISARHLSRQTQVALSKLREQLERAGQATAATSERPGTAAAGAGRRSGGASPRELPAESRKVSRPRHERRDGVPDSDRSGAVRHHRDLPYHVLVFRDNGQGEGLAWTAHAEELPGCEAHGETIEEAVRAIEGAIDDWIEDAVAHGHEPPEPRSAASYSGRLMLRMPRSLHAELSRAAERDEVSLNRFIGNSLQTALASPGRAAGDDTEHAAGDGQAGRGVSSRVPAVGSSGPGLLRLAIVINLIVVLTAGVVAVIVLLVASQHGW
jgi:RNA polymerase sigma-B factor